jgi:hypothetical protein
VRTPRRLRRITYPWLPPRGRYPTRSLEVVGWGLGGGSGRGRVGFRAARGAWVSLRARRRMRARASFVARARHPKLIRRAYLTLGLRSVREGRKVCSNARRRVPPLPSPGVFFARGGHGNASCAGRRTSVGASRPLRPPGVVHRSRRRALAAAGRRRGRSGFVETRQGGRKPLTPRAFWLAWVLSGRGARVCKDTRSRLGHWR